MASNDRYSASQSESPRASTSRERHDEPVETKPALDQLQHAMYGDDGADDGAVEYAESNDDTGRASGDGTGPTKKGGGKRSSATAGSVKLDENGNPKKKRKQLVACDSCRLRRVKCDKADMHGGPCSECIKKSITCTDTYVKNKPKVVRGGKLIAQAKKLYGGQESIDLDGSPHDGYEELSGEAYLPAPIGQSAFDRSAPGRPLMMNQLTPDVSDHLIRIFFRVFQPQCPLVDEEYFLKAWEAAGRNLADLSPALEVLALAMQAWAARFTDHVSIIGSNGPTLTELRNGAGRDFTMIGKLREGFAKSLLDRAIETVDRRAALRTASAACCSALVLLEFLVTWDDVARKSNLGRYLLSSACEHLRNLQLGECDDPAEPLVPPERASNGTLLWMVYTRDALGAMLGGRSCAFSDDDLNSLSDLFNSPITADVISYVSSSDPRMLSGLAVAAIFRYSVSTVRNTVSRLTGPLARRLRLNAQAVHELWAQIDECARYGAIFRQSVDRVTFGPEAPKTDVWFRDLTAMKSQNTLGIHLALCARLREEESKQQDDVEYLNALRHLKQLSDNRLFRAAREYCQVLHSYGGNLIFAATVTPEYSAHYLESLVDMASWEQGGPSDWPWNVKKSEVAKCIEVIQLAGWCWPGYDLVVYRAQCSMKRQHILLDRMEESQAAADMYNGSLRTSYPHQGDEGSSYPPQGWSQRGSNGGHIQYASYNVDTTHAYTSSESRSTATPQHGAAPPHDGRQDQSHPGSNGHGIFIGGPHALAPLRGPPVPAYQDHADSDPNRLPSLTSYRPSPPGPVSAASTRASLPSISAYAQAPPPAP